MAHADEVPRERGLRDRGQNGQAIPISLPTADGDLAAPEVDVLHPEPGAFEQPQAGAVEQRRHEPVNPLELADHDANFVAGEHDGEPGGSPGANQLVEPRHVPVEHVAVQEEKGRERRLRWRSLRAARTRSRRRGGGALGTIRA